MFTLIEQNRKIKFDIQPGLLVKKEGVTVRLRNPDPFYMVSDQDILYIQ